MNTSKLVASSAILVVLALLAIVSSSEARYSDRPNRHVYSDSGCHGHRCQRPSYAAPAIYGGRGLYNYHGYARHQPAPPLTNHAHYRGIRSYSSNGHQQQSRHYGLRPVHALALAPANSYSGNRSHGQTKANYRHLAAPSYGYNRVASHQYNNNANYHQAHQRPAYRSRMHNAGYRRPSHGAY